MALKVPFLVIFTFLIYLTLPTSAWSTCVASSLNERLSNFCLFENTYGVNNRSDFIKYVDIRIKKEGYSDGIGLGLIEKAEPVVIQTFLMPTLSHSTNTNGGNPNKALVLGGATFIGNPALERKPGMLAGLSGGMTGRGIYGSGKYVDLDLRASYSVVPQSPISVMSFSGNLCSKNHIKTFWFIDMCLLSEVINKKITNENISSFKLSTSKMFSAQNTGAHELSVGFKKQFQSLYTQNKAFLDIESISKNGLYSKFTFTIGEPKNDNLTSRKSFNASVKTLVLGKPFFVTGTYNISKGGKILGYGRDENTSSINFSYPLDNRITLGIGYTKINSSIDYFSISEPNFNIQFNPIHFYSSVKR